jgi:N4-(beta-N-acetylglucosaminyl)-L-asparaginase
MTSRKTFLKQSLLSSTLLLPSALSNQLQRLDPTEKKPAYGPVILSTWNHGQKANAEAWRTLENSGTILDAVEQGVKVTEADPNSRTVGLNGYPDREGIVTLDASIMTGDGNCGSVCFVRRIKHPITLARHVMEKTPHVMLAGAGAQKFAVEQGMPLEEEELHPESRERYEEWLKTAEYRPEVNIENYDTIGMIGVDGEGNLAGSCTTSGLKFKMHGRVGDSPIIGAGLYVDNEVGAACATGEGEAIMKISGSFLVVELMRQGRSPQEACEEAVRRLIRKADIHREFQVGFLALNREGQAGAKAVVPGFTYARHDQRGNSLSDVSSHYSSIDEMMR